VNIDAVRHLTEILTAHGLTALEVSEGDLKIRLEKSTQTVIAPQETIDKPVIPVSGNLAALDDDPELNFGNLTEVKSPVVGVFYAAPSPGAEPFVHIGSKVKKGDTLCIVEAMKLMNEIAAEQDGEIVDVCMKDGDIAEFGQILFKMF
jgi:acetyl-CoA carboxylase biotin carboxyl carrier protein